MGLFSKKVSCLGLDIGEQSIKIISLRKSSRGYEITEFQDLAGSAAPAAAASVAGGGTLGFDGARVVAAVSGDNVMVRNLTLPVMPDSELAEAVKFEAEAILPLPAREVTTDFLKYGVISDGGIRKQEVLLVAVRNEAIQKLLAAGAAVGIEPNTVDIEPLALQRAVRKLNPGGVPAQTNYAIVHIGFGSTSISIFREDCLFFTRTLYTGEHKLMLSLVNYGHLAAQEALVFLAAVDLSMSPDESAAADVRSTEVIVNIIGELVTDIERSLNFYLAEHRGQDVARLFVTGRGARLKGLKEYISSRLDIPVEVFNPTTYLNINSKIEHTTEDIRNAGPALTQVVGLALSEVD